MSRTVKNKFSAPNVNYSQDYLNFISQIDLHRLKFFDEMGVCLFDCNKRYGHSLKNTPCVEVGRLIKSAHITLNFLGGLDGVMYANTINGVSDTIEFLNFFAEASRSLSTKRECRFNGRRYSRYGQLCNASQCRWVCTGTSA